MAPWYSPPCQDGHYSDNWRAAILNYVDYFYVFFFLFSFQDLILHEILKISLPLTLRHNTIRVTNVEVMIQTRK
jgi:hypothetical protein